MFRQQPFAFPPVVQKNIEGVRRYVTPEGNSYESVTTFLSPRTDKTRIKEWRERIGTTKADAHTSSAAFRGRDIHKLCEKFLLNEEIDRKKSNPINLFAFGRAQAILENHITLVHNVETRVYSDRLKLGGTLDVLAEWDKVPAIIDFKTSAKVKDKDMIEHHFLQATAYTIMVFERIGLLPKKIVIIFIPSDDQPQFYEENPNKYLGKLLHLVEERNLTLLPKDDI